MPSERFYIDEVLEQGLTVSLKNEEFHHLAHVIRTKAGDTIELINGKGVLAFGLIETIDKKQAQISISSIESLEAPPAYELVLAQAMPRQPRLEYILEKSVELGVTKIWLFPGMLSEKKEFSPSQIERINYIITSAMKQCGRLFIPELILLPSILSWKQEILPKASFFGDTSPEAELFLDNLIRQKETSLLIAIGPEKGFHPKEEAYMSGSLAMNGVHLHKNILRTDTAAIFSLSLASAFLNN